MVTQALPQVIVSPFDPKLAQEVGWAFGWLGRNDKPARRRALKRVAEAIAEMVDAQFDAAYDSLGYDPATPDDRWAWYTQGKSPLDWAEQWGKIPRHAAEDFIDMQKLGEKHVEDGTLSPAAFLLLVRNAQLGGPNAVTV